MNVDFYNRSGNYGAVRMADNVFLFEVGTTYSSVLNTFDTSNDTPWEQSPVTVGKFQVIPYGAQNNLSTRIRQVMEENHLMPGVLRKKGELLWGQGPGLYSEVMGKEISREWQQDPEIQEWLESWNYKQYLLHAIVDYNHSEMVFTKFFRNRGARLGMGSQVAKLEHVNVDNARFQYTGRGLRYPRNVVVGDMMYETDLLQLYPLFNPKDPFAYPVCVHYSNLYSFARSAYNTPTFYGGLNWIERSSAIPKILKNLTDNSLHIKWHIKSPAIYWEQKEEMLKRQCEAKGETYTPDLLENYKDEVFKSLAKVLAGESNVGKFFQSEIIRNDRGEVEGWEIEPIDQKVKDYVDAQLAISKSAQYATTSSLGLDPALSNISHEGKESSGSEKLYALKLYLATGVDIPETIVCDAINTAIKLNWPEKKLKLGFFHRVVMNESVVSPQSRVKDAV